MPSFHAIGRRSALRALFWYLLGVVSLPAAVWIINHTTLADPAVRPLLTSDSPDRADAIVVLGAGVSDECTLNDYSLRRTLLGTRLYKDGRAPLVLFTGGARTGTRCAVASVMADVAREAGVPASAVMLETAAHDTHQNAEYSAPILNRLGVRSILLVTDRLHMTRSELCFATFGFAVRRASVPLFDGSSGNAESLYWAVRERIAIVIYRWRGWIDKKVEP
jgi:uncharacterized SAM-binding protein YcdF (DUF218 family)